MDLTRSSSESNGEVQAALEHILRSKHFAQAPRLSAFLRLVVEKTLRGEADDIKEYLIGAEVYERGQNYDPRVDSIVRVEANRLRARLRTYYGTDGTGDTLRIELLKGSYVLVFRTVAILRAAPAPRIPPRQASRRAWLLGAGASAAAGAVFVASRSGVLAHGLPVALLMTSERARRGGWSAEAEDLSLHFGKIARRLRRFGGASQP